MTIDIRQSTCPGGGAIWTLLSHIRELPAGDSIEILTDDPLAGTDIPAYVRERQWSVSVDRERGFDRVLVEKPLISG